jgi:nicotinate-nucleotide--dimethylbenzimidazole phosphoribosyltransferase
LQGYLVASILHRMRQVLDHIIESITEASRAQAAAVRERLKREELAQEGDALLDVTARLAGARHSPRPSLTNKVAAVVAADHGFASPGVDLGENQPSLLALRLMAEGGAALNSAARSADTSLVLIDAGIWGGDRFDIGPGVLSFRVGNGTADFRKTSAMSEADAIAGLQTGIAIAFSLADTGLDVMALGHLGLGGKVSSLALTSALLGLSLSELCDDERDLEVAREALACHGDALTPLGALAAVGGYEIAVLAGLVLACASVHVPVVLDGEATAAAALVAVRLCPSASGYLFAAHSGGKVLRALTAELQLNPLFAMGLSHGEGTGSVMALSMLEAAGRVVREA